LSHQENILLCTAFSIIICLAVAKCEGFHWNYFSKSRNYFTNQHGNVVSGMRCWET